ncbi:taste receptor type 2 member 40-like [Anomaloglossus baeobatrachus]|uniref:taste receptor type 2 member 40-like n=1 Tax=Anomaloglossus baeobatrachus TaxID=238106 RepID=UPI003F4FEB6D
MNIPLWLSFTLLGFLENLVGIPLNTFLVVENINVLRFGSEGNPSALLHFFIAMVNIFLHVMMISEELLFVVCRQVFFIKGVAGFYLTLITALMYFQYWLIAWLCLLYFSSTTTFSHKFIVWLKRHIRRLLPYLLLVSAAVSFAVSILFIPEGFTEPSVNVTLDSGFPDYTLNTVFMMLFTFLCCWPPFIISLVSAGFTASSLITHIRNMKRGVLGFTRPQLKIYINAVRTMTLLILLSVSYYLIAIFGFAIHYRLDDLHLLDWFFGVSFPTIEAAIIIQSNSKLRKTLRSWSSSTCRRIRKVNLGWGEGDNI